LEKVPVERIIVEKTATGGSEGEGGCRRQSRIHSGKALRAIAKRKLMQAILDRQLQFLELYNPGYVRQTLGLLCPQLFIQPLVLRQETENTFFHDCHSNEQLMSNRETDAQAA
jgi:hypothetical protein